MPQTAAKETHIEFQARGANAGIFTMDDPELLLAGAAGTGKSRAILEKIHLLCLKYPNLRCLMVRKTYQSLKAAAITTYDTEVVQPSDHVIYFGGNGRKPPQYIYPNGSVLLIGGLDDPMKVMSQQYDIIYVQEATEVTFDDWMALNIRLRNGALRYQQLIADCNPGAPSHWLKKRCDEGKCRLLTSVHENNPALFDDAGRITPRGRDYIARLDQSSGVWYKRYRLGQWAAAEGQVYDTWNRDLHVIDRFPIPREWLKFRAIDFGYTAPFVCQWWAVDPKDRMYLYRELYMSGRIVDDHARQIVSLTGAEQIAFTVADHNAEDRATLDRGKIKTISAKKKISPGIQAMTDRLRERSDGRPGLLVLRDSLVEVDTALKERGKPINFETEIEAYVWPLQNGKAIKEVPIQIDDHAMDCARYACMAMKSHHRIVAPQGMTKPSIWRRSVMSA